MLIIWGLRVVYRTLGRGVFFCRRCGGDREYRHRAGRRYITIFFIPLVPLTTTGEHVQCLTCKTRYVTEVLKLPTTVQMQVALVAGMRAMVAIILRAGDPVSPLSRRRALDAVAGAGDSDYDEEALEADLVEPADTARPKIAALGAQLQIEAREWCLAEAIRIAMADGPLAPTERVAAEQLAAALGMTQAQAIGVIALTEQNIVLLALWLLCQGVRRPDALGLLSPAATRGRGNWNHESVRADRLFTGMSHELLLLSGRGGGR